MTHSEYGDDSANFGGDAAGEIPGMPAADANPMGGQRDEAAAQRDHILRQILMPDARMRLGNIRMVKPEIANMVEQQLVALATQGRIQAPITDAQLRQMLSTIQQPKREFKFNRI